MDVKFYLVTIISLFIAIYSWRMPSSEINNRFGIRCKWSMHNINTWKRSNIVAAILINFCTVFTIVSGVFIDKNLAFPVFITSLIVATVMSLLYSYIFYLSEINKLDVRKSFGFYCLILFTLSTLVYVFLYFWGLNTFKKEIVVHCSNGTPDSFMTINQLFFNEFIYIILIPNAFVLLVSYFFNFLLKFKKGTILTSNILFASLTILLAIITSLHIYLRECNSILITYLPTILSIILSLLFVSYFTYILFIFYDRFFSKKQ